MRTLSFPIVHRVIFVPFPWQLCFRSSVKVFSLDVTRESSFSTAQQTGNVRKDKGLDSTSSLNICSLSPALDAWTGVVAPYCRDETNKRESKNRLPLVIVLLAVVVVLRRVLLLVLRGFSFLFFDYSLFFSRYRSICSIRSVQKTCSFFSVCRRRRRWLFYYHSRARSICSSDCARRKCEKREINTLFHSQVSGTRRSLSSDVKDLNIFLSFFVGARQLSLA